MGIDALFSEVRKALEQAFLLADVELSKDYLNDCLIVRALKSNARDECNLEELSEAREESSDSDNWHSPEQKYDQNYKVEIEDSIYNGSEQSNCSDIKVFEESEEKNNFTQRKGKQYLGLNNGTNVVSSETGKMQYSVKARTKTAPSSFAAVLSSPIDETMLDLPSDLPTIAYAEESVPVKLLPDGTIMRGAQAVESSYNPARLEIYRTVFNDAEDVGDLKSSSSAAFIGVGATPSLMKRKGKKRKKPLSFPSSCYICDYVWNGRLEYSKHMKTHGPPFICPVCQHQNKGKVAFLAHMRSHTGEKPYKCDVCGEALRTRGTLKQHKIKHLTENSFSCQYCDYGCKSSSSLIQHIKCVHPETCHLYKCPSCDFTTVDEKRRLSHINAHEQNLSFPCDVCGKLFYERRDLQLHVRIHKKTEPRKKNIVCPECGEKFYNNQRLSSHRYKHTGQKNFKCRLCGLEHRKLWSVLKHFKKFHPTEKIFHCELCSFYTDNLREKNKHYTSVLHLEKESAVIKSQ